MSAETTVEVEMKVLADHGDTVYYRCACGTKFLASPCGEDNVVFDEVRGYLRAQCPGCQGVGQ